jgi:hypothetical protein
MIPREFRMLQLGDTFQNIALYQGGYPRLHTMFIADSALSGF